MATLASAAFAAPLALPWRGARAPAVAKVSARRAPVRRARMSLVNDLLFKAVEVGAATYATTLVSASARGGGAEDGANGVAGAVPNFRELPAQLREVLTAAERAAAELPAMVERGTPESRKWIKLALCLALDLVGSGSLPVPLLADALDIVWAPLAALALHALFANPVITAAGFAEEILPGTDGIPTASLAWINEHYGDAIKKSFVDLNVQEVKAKEVVPEEEEGRRSPFGGAFERRPKRQREKSASRRR